MGPPSARRPRLKVLFHDRCFDGAASAALFTSFFRGHLEPAATVAYEGLMHRPEGAPIRGAVFEGELNALLDFRYSQDDRLTWWFDHHGTAFQGEGDAEHFERDRSGRKFLDPTAKSCAGFLSRLLTERFGFDASPFADLVRWADRIDTADFESPEQSVFAREPALQLMLAIEQSEQPDFIPRVIEHLQRATVDEVAGMTFVREASEPLMRRNEAALRIVRERASCEDGVVFFDVTEERLERINKFLGYYLYPDAAYVVWLGRGSGRVRLSLGANPWRPELRRLNLSEIATRYGGGGHPVVGAASFPDSELERAREAAREVVAILRRA